MKSLANIIEGFFGNVASYTPKTWFEKVQFGKPNNMFYGERWSREYTCRVHRSGVLELFHIDEDDHINSHGVLDLNKGMVWIELCKNFSPLDYKYSLEPSRGYINLRVWNYKDYKNNPMIHVIFQEYKGKMRPFEMKIENHEMLCISDKLYRSKGYYSGGFNTGEYIQNNELISKFIGS